MKKKTNEWLETYGAIKLSENIQPFRFEQVLTLCGQFFNWKMNKKLSQGNLSCKGQLPKGANNFSSENQMTSTRETLILCDKLLPPMSKVRKNWSVIMKF